MLPMWEKTGRTKASPLKVAEYYMDPVHIARVHPKLVKGVKILSNEGDTVTWEQSLSFMGLNLHSVVKSSLNRVTGSIETQSIGGVGKGTRMTRTLTEIPTGTEVHYAYRPKLGALGFLVRRRAIKGFEETVEEDLKALDMMT